MLKISDLTAGYDGVNAIHGIDFEVFEHESVAVVGPNGAGKSTLLKAISGTVDVYGGSIELDGASLRDVGAPNRVDLGFVHVPQGRMVFSGMTVLDNLRVGAFRPGARDRFEERLQLVSEVFPKLMEMAHRHGGELSGGQQQMLALARGVMTCPRLLMLDEPSQGLAPIITEQIFEAVQRLLADRELTVIVVEQRAHEALEICQRAYVLESGEVAIEAPARSLLDDPALAKAYLGG
jgi:branched-chain amino acid transport system ATP-binding protein